MKNEGLTPPVDPVSLDLDVLKGDRSSLFPARLTVGPLDELFVYAYIDPCDPPREIMIGWHDGNWDHRAYWGENLFPYGGAGRVRIGDLPEAGRWVKLSVPASTMLLTGSTIDGMAFSVYGGRVWFDRAGVSACAFPPPAAPVLKIGDTVWVDDAPPAGAVLSGSWSWDPAQKARGTQSMGNPAWKGPREFWFSGATTPLRPAPTDQLFGGMIWGQVFEVRSAPQSFSEQVLKPLRRRNLDFSLHGLSASARQHRNDTREGFTLGDLGGVPSLTHVPGGSQSRNDALTGPEIQVVRREREGTR